VNDRAPTPKRARRAHRDDGSATILVAAVVGALLVLSLGAADVARVFVAAARAQTAADASALAAAQSLAIADAGDEPVDAAGEFAERNGASLESCACDRGTFEATVSVSVPVGELFLVTGTRRVVATARAQVDLPGL
jgi:secretion/DNA translocation related TadE-like protein